jgi:hypothetical protein
MRPGTLEAHEGADGRLARRRTWRGHDQARPPRLALRAIAADLVFGLVHEHFEALLELLLVSHYDGVELNNRVVDTA